MFGEKLKTFDNYRGSSDGTYLSEILDCSRFHNGMVSERRILQRAGYGQTVASWIPLRVIKRLPPKEPVPRTVANIENWFEDFLDDDETSAEGLDAFLKTAEKDAEFTVLVETDYLGIPTMVAQHGNITPATLTVLLQIEDDYAMRAIAQQP